MRSFAGTANVLTLRNISLSPWSLCNKTFPGKKNHACLLIPNTESMAGQNTNTIKVRHGEPMSFIQVTYKSMGEGLLRGAERTQRHRHRQFHPAWVAAHKTWELGEYCTACRQRWRVSFPATSLGPNISQVAGWFLVSGRQLV